MTKQQRSVGKASTSVQRSPENARNCLPLRDADQKMVEGCEFVGDIMGASPLGVVFGSMSTANAKEIALGDASGRGATHIVWASITPPSFGSGAVASGKAYRCVGGLAAIK